MTDAANSAQIAYWNEGAGETWADLQERMDGQLAPLGDAAREALAPQAGERMLDVGCGCGQTTLELAQVVGEGGHVTGVDVSRPMLEVARRRAVPSGSGATDFEEADAQTAAFAPGGFDAIYSRFGVMFFADPAAALANLRRGLKAGGRMAFVCWRPMAENPMFTAPLTAALAHLPPPPPPEPNAPGPFAFADPDRLRSLLETAAFTEIEITPRDIPISPGTLDQGVAVALRIGPLGGMMREHPEAREAVVRDVRAACERYVVDGRVRFPSATWVVTARNP